MTSPVDTSVKHFHSDMVGAPKLNGAAGTMIAVLNACLVDGFGVQVATSLVVAGGVATLNFAASHAAEVDTVIVVSGATPAGLNGEQKVTAVETNKVKFATAEADGTATGTISFKMASAGWSKPFVGTNLAVYKSVDPMAHGMFFRVNDASATDARVIGYETMTAVNTGTGPFPTTAQFNGGPYWNKAYAAGTEQQKWECYADSRFVVFIQAPGPVAYGSPLCTAGLVRGFGDLVALRPSGDKYATAVFGARAATSGDRNDSMDVYDGTLTGNALARAVSGQGTAVLCGSLAYSGNPGYLSGTELVLGRFPSEVDGKLILSRRFVGVVQPGYGVPPRGNIPGFFTSPQSELSVSIFTRQVIEGSGELLGRRLKALSTGEAPFAVGAPSMQNGVAFVDITGPWR